MSKKIFIKAFWEKTQKNVGTKSLNGNFEEALKIVYDYERKLCEKGWHDNPVDGGCVSPDLSAIFYTVRSPYEGQVLQWTGGKDEEYRNIVKKFIDSGEFIEVDW